MDKKLPPLKQSPLISSRQNSIKSPKPGSQQLQQLHLQGLIQKRIDLIIAKMFENIEMMIQERPFYVLNEAELNCDPMTDHENPKNIYPIFKHFLSEQKVKAVRTLQLDIDHELLSYFSTENSRSLTDDQVDLLLQRAKLAELQVCEQTETASSRLQKHSAERENLQMQLNQQRQQILEFEKMGVLYKADKIKALKDLQQEGKVEIYINSLQTDIYHQNSQIKFLESKLDQANAELERLKREIDNQTKIASTKIQIQERKVEINLDKTPEFEAKINQMNTNFLNFRRQAELAFQEQNMEKLGKLLNQSHALSRAPSRSGLQIVDLNAQRVLEKIEIIDPFAGFGDVSGRNCSSALPFVFGDNGAITYLGKEARFLKRVNDGKVTFLDTVIGRIYSQHKKGLWGYEDEHQRFYFRNNQGKLFRFVGDELYMLDSQHRQIVPDSYGKGEGRIYVTEDGLKYNIDQFNQPFISTDNKRTYLDLDTFEPYNPPFFREYEFKMKILEKYTQPMLPPKDVLVDTLNKRQHISELQQVNVNDKMYYIGSDTKHYSVDSLGFYYQENDGVYRVDSKGQILCQKKSFSYQVSNNELLIDNVPYFFDELHGYFFCTDPENNRIALDRNLNQYKIVNHTQGEKLKDGKPPILTKSGKQSASLYKRADTQNIENKGSAKKNLFENRAAQLKQIITGATDDGLIFIIDSQGNKVIPAGKRKITVDGNGNYYEEIDGKKVKLNSSEINKIKDVQLDKDIIEQEKVKIANENHQIEQKQSKITVNGVEYVVDDEGHMFTVSKDGTQVEITGEQKAKLMQNPAVQSKVEKLLLGKPAKKVINGKTFEEGSDGEIYEIQSNGQKVKADKATVETFQKRKDSQIVVDGEIYEENSDGDVFQVSATGEKVKIDLKRAGEVKAKRQHQKEKQVVMDGKIYEEGSDGEFYETGANGTKKIVSKMQQQLIKRQKQATQQQKQILVDGQIYEEGSDGEIYAVQSNGSHQKISAGQAQEIRQKKHQIQQKQVIVDGQICEEGSDGEIYLVKPDGTKQKADQATAQKAAQKKLQKQIIVDGQIYEEGAGGEVFAVQADGRKVKVSRALAASLKQKKTQAKQTVIDGKMYETGDDGEIYEVDTRTGAKKPVSAAKIIGLKQKIAQKQSKKEINGKIFEEGADGEIYEIDEHGNQKLADPEFSKIYRQKKHKSQVKKLIKHGNLMMEVTSEGVIRYNQDGTTTLLNKEESEAILNDNTVKAQLASITGETAQIGDKKFVRNENGEVFEVQKDGSVKKLNEKEIKNLKSAKFTSRQAVKSVIKNAVEDENGVKFIYNEDGSKKILVPGREINMDDNGNYVETMADGTKKVLQKEDIQELKQYQENNQNQIDKLVKIQQSSAVRKKLPNKIGVEPNGAVYELVDGKKHYLTEDEAKSRNIYEQLDKKEYIPLERTLSVQDLALKVSSAYKDNFIDDGTNFGCQVGVSFFNKIRKEWKGVSKVMELSNRVNEMLKSRIMVRQSRQDADKERVDKNRQTSFVINLAQAFGGK
ncbi:hypothetical protein SS50377_24285 [Spironucleus salmonicida]|uniref:Uncharacterized protein n=1 Tax=Spironucleus salmonicida TaxID=348837 RepID=V6LJQ3_9EUKA|nr:hypothetical protein SS50377_24285 [Spironucleus salmonicida]|eukprot:EST44825.1 hypothetical protein SS50377_15271 [Spironucleus salmonicida]